jgi:hypothetical protein
VSDDDDQHNDHDHHHDDAVHGPERLSAVRRSGRVHDDVDGAARVAERRGAAMTWWLVLLVLLLPIALGKLIRRGRRPLRITGEITIRREP